MPISTSDAIHLAMEHTKHQLLRPFRFAQWVKLAFVGILAGELGSAGGCNGHFNLPPPNQHKGAEQLFSMKLPPDFGLHPHFWVALVILLVVLAMVLMAAFLYVSSVMRFVLFDSVLNRECRIRASWRRRKSEGLRLFVWQILFSAVVGVAVIVLIGIPLGMAWIFGLFRHPERHWVAFILGGLLLFTAFLLIVIAAAVVHVMTKDFVVPQMAFESVTATEGWRRLWESMMAEKAGYAGYLGMKIVLAIAAGILIAIVTILAFLATILPVAIGVVAAVFAGHPSGWVWDAYSISLIVLGGLILAGQLIFLISIMNVPAIVFFPAYAMYFFAARYQPLANAIWRTPSSVVSPPAPEGPPLPPAPAPLG